MTEAAGSMLARAQAALRDGDLAKASRMAAEAIGTYRASRDLRRFGDGRRLLGDIARAADDPSGAEQHFRAALSAYIVLDDRYWSARMLSAIADLRYRAGDYADAEELNRQAVERMPGDVSALTGLAYAQWYGGSPADAEATFDQALQWDSQTPLALAGRGQIRADLGRYEKALDDLDRVLRQQRLADEEETDTRSARALALAGLGRVAEARDELSAILKRDPERARSRLRAGRIAALLGERERMRAEFERALHGHSALSVTELEAARRTLRTAEGAEPEAIPPDSGE